MAAQREPGAFEAFFEDQYSLVVTVIARRFVGGYADAENLAADVFQIAWSHYQKGHELTLPWLYTTARTPYC